MAGFFIGLMASRMGIRRVAMIGAVVNGSATVLGSFTNDILQLYACNALCGKLRKQNKCYWPYVSNLAGSFLKGKEKLS